MMCFRLGALVSALTIFSTSEIALANDDTAFFEGIIELETGWSLDQSQPEEGSVAATIEMVGGANLTPHWSFAGGVIIEPVLDIDAPDSFETEGLYLDSLLLQYATGQSTFYLGKFAPVFATAWDVTPGVFGTELAESYELAEFVGFGGDMSLSRWTGIESGELVASWSVFTADTSVFSNSALRQRGRTNTADGGVGNTDGLNSFALALDAYDVVGDGVQLHIAYRTLTANDGVSLDETAFATAVLISRELSGGQVLDFNAEWVGFDNPGGVSGDGSAITLGAGLGLGAWRLGVSHSWLDSTVIDSADDEAVSQVSAGYDFQAGYSFDIALKSHESDGHSETFAGAILSFEFD